MLVADQPKLKKEKYWSACRSSHRGAMRPRVGGGGINNVSLKGTPWVWQPSLSNSQKDGNNRGVFLHSNQLSTARKTAEQCEPREDEVVGCQKWGTKMEARTW